MIENFPTANGMGWTNSSPNEVACEFLRDASAGACLVDIGAAFGVATIPALVRGLRVVANDVSIGHLERLADSVPLELAGRLRLMEGRFPDEMRLPSESVDSVLASNVLHFLRGEDLLLGLRVIHAWLRPGGTLHVLVNSPYLAYLKRAIPTFEAGILSGKNWPGEITNVHEICDPQYISNLPPFLHVFNDTTLSEVVNRAGFEVERCEMFRRRTPPFGILDGRENVRLRAQKRQSGSSGLGELFSAPMLVVGASLIEPIRRLRKAAWEADGVDIIDGPIFADGHDEHATHWVIEDRGGEIIAAARICIHRSLAECPDAGDFRSLIDIPGAVACFNRLVVAPHARRNGLSLLLDEARIRFAGRRDCASIVVSSDLTRAQHLEHRGFRFSAMLPRRTAVAKSGVALRMSLGEARLRRTALD